MVGKPQLDQCAGSHPRGMLDGRFAARKWQVAQVIGALEANPVGHQHLAAPDGAVIPQSRAVERQAHHRLGPSVLAGDGGDMGVMVLDLGQRQAGVRGLLVGPFAGQVLGVRVAGQLRRTQVKQALVQPERLLPKLA